MKFLVVGCGSIGERHIKNLIGLSCEVAACDIYDEILQKIKSKYDIQVFKDIKKALGNSFDGVIISVPTKYHVQIAKIALEKNNNVFIEKPISHNLNGIDELIELAEEKKLVNLVACNMRFHPCVNLLKKIIDGGKIRKIFGARLEYGHYLPSWRPDKDYRKIYSSQKSEGGGIILDAIHELDYIQWLLGNVKEIFCNFDKLSNLQVDTEDIVEIFLKINSGALVEIHLDCLQMKKRRSCELIGEKGTVIWESIGKQPEKAIVKLFSKETEEVLFEGEIDLNDMYVKEMKHFINCIKGKEESLQPIKIGKNVLEIALAANESSKNKKVILF